MSAVSAARKRRTGPLPAEPVYSTPATNIQSNNNNIPQQPKMGLTLQEVIALVDKRLVTLEKFMGDTKSQTTTDIPREPKIKFELEEDSTENSRPLNDEIIEEFNSRFLLLTEEMTNLKDIILNLQSYTMSVNKILMEERVQIISDLGTIIEEDEEEDGKSIPKEKEEEQMHIEAIYPIDEEVKEVNQVDEEGMTKYGIPTPDKIPKIQPKSVKFV